MPDGPFGFPEEAEKLLTETLPNYPLERILLVVKLMGVFLFFVAILPVLMAEPVEVENESKKSEEATNTKLKGKHRGKKSGKRKETKVQQHLHHGALKNARKGNRNATQKIVMFKTNRRKNSFRDDAEQYLEKHNVRNVCEPPKRLEFSKCMPGNKKLANPRNVRELSQTGSNRHRKKSLKKIQHANPKFVCSY